MMQFFSQALSDKLVVALVGAAAGMGGTLLVGVLWTRSARFRYSTRVDRIGTSADDHMFCTERVQWRNNDVRNLYIAVVEIENASSKDFEDVGLPIYTGKDTLLLSEQTRMIDSPNTVLWSPDFRARLEGPAGGVLDDFLTQAQWKIYNHRREYLVPVFNRGQVVEFRYACTRPGDDLLPNVFVNAPVKGVKLLHHQTTQFVLGAVAADFQSIYAVPFELSLVRGTVSSLVISVLAAWFFEGSWIATAVVFLVGYTALLQGALISKATRRLWNAIVG